MVVVDDLTPNKNNILRKISKIRNEIKVPKTGYQAFGNTKFHYYELPEIYKHAVPLFEKYGVFTVFNLEAQSDNQFLRGCLTAINIDYPTDHVVFTMDSPLHKGNGSPCQLAGATNTYLLKYLLMNLLMLDDCKDDPDRTMHRDIKDNDPTKVPVSKPVKEPFF